ncbi:hypothetical protein ASC74_30400 [Pseudomonas sp. Root329]|nr:hypothetical protein ASC74_30400 [Pseudomonas sp. Root329]
MKLREREGIEGVVPSKRPWRRVCWPMVDAQRMPTMADRPSKPAWALENPYGGKASKTAIKPA